MSRQIAGLRKEKWRRRTHGKANSEAARRAPGLRAVVIAKESARRQQLNVSAAKRQLEQARSRVQECERLLVQDQALLDRLQGELVTLVGPEGAGDRATLDRLERDTRELVVARSRLRVRGIG